MTLKLIHLDSAKKILAEDFKTFSANPSASNWRVLEASMLRYQQGILLGTDYLGGCLYENPKQFVTESGYYDDMVNTAIADAQSNLNKLYALRDEVTA